MANIAATSGNIFVVFYVHTGTFFMNWILSYLCVPVLQSGFSYFLVCTFIFDIQVQVFLYECLHRWEPYYGKLLSISLGQVDREFSLSWIRQISKIWGSVVL